MTARAQPTTWRELTRIEPRLKDLYRRIKAIKDDGTAPAFCANAHWYGYGYGNAPGFKEPMCRLVGWQAENRDPRLRTMEAYDLAYMKLYEALPNCRNCNCLSP